MASPTNQTDIEGSIQRLIESGRFQTREEVLREGVRRIETEDAHWADLDAGIARGLADASAGRVKPAEEVFDRLIAKYHAIAKPQ
jgi:antitoxin ParD1/3/4